MKQKISILSVVKNIYIQKQFQFNTKHSLTFTDLVHRLCFAFICSYLLFLLSKAPALYHLHYERNNPYLQTLLCFMALCLDYTRIITIYGKGQSVSFSTNEIVCKIYFLSLTLFLGIKSLVQDSLANELFCHRGIVTFYHSS